jgi:tRNA(fMet)-specific endonuclease VapC
VTAYLFDTNMISALVHQRGGFARVAARIDALAVQQRLVSAITLSELETMIAKAKDPNSKFAKVRLVLAHFNLLDFNEGAALHAGRIRAHLEPRGFAIGPLDTLIAAHARSVGATMVTDNVKEFSRVPELKVVNWLR